MSVEVSSSTSKVRFFSRFFLEKKAVSDFCYFTRSKSAKFSRSLHSQTKVIVDLGGPSCLEGRTERFCSHGWGLETIQVSKLQFYKKKSMFRFSTPTQFLWYPMDGRTLYSKKWSPLNISNRTGGINLGRFLIVFMGISFLNPESDILQHYCFSVELTDFKSSVRSSDCLLGKISIFIHHPNNSSV